MIALLSGGLHLSIRRPKRQREALPGLSVAAATVGFMIIVLTALGNACGEANPKVTPPDRIVTFEESPYIGDVALSADGKRAFVVIFLKAVNIWALAVYYWPEVLGAVGALLTLGGGLRILRTLTRRQIAGKRCCPRCGYCVEYCTLDTCPECGYPHAATRAVIGRTGWRRTSSVTVALGAYWMAYTVALGLGVPRTGPLAMAFKVWSVKLAKWGEEHQCAPIIARTCRASKVVEIDVRTGRLVRSLLTGSYYNLDPTSIHHDGGILLAHSIQDRLLQAVDSDSGQVIQCLRYGKWADRLSLGGPIDLTQLEGCSPDDRSAYYVWNDRFKKHTQLVVWNLRTGDTRIVFEADASMSKSSDGAYLRPIVNGTRILEFSDAPWGGQPVGLCVRDLEHPEQILSRRPHLWCHGRPFGSRDGQYAYFLEASGRAVIMREFGYPPSEEALVVHLSRLDLRTGQVETAIDDNLCVSADRLSVAAGYDSEHGWFLASAFTEPRRDGDARPVRQHENNVRWLRGEPMVVAGSVALGRWIHWFQCPGARSIRSLAVSPNGRTLAAVIDAGMARRLLFFDLDAVVVP